MKILSSFPVAACGLTALLLVAMPAVSQQFSATRVLSAAQATSQPKQPAAKKQPKKLSPDEILRKRNIMRRTAAVLDACRQKIEGRIAPNVETYRTEVEQEVRLGTRQFSARGVYIQGKGLKRRLDLKMKFGPKGRMTVARLLQVCNGDVLTTQQIVNNRPRVTRRNVREILKATEQYSASKELDRIRGLGLGGIGGLIASLQMTMTFDEYESKQVGNTKLFILGGGWNERYQNLFAPSNRNGRFPEHIPDRVRVEVDTNDLVRRIQFLKKDPKDDSHYSIMTMSFRNIELNPPDLNPKKGDTAAQRKLDQLFTIKLAKNAYEENTTQRYIDQLKAAAQQAKAEQKQ